jgi:hypothetical protein
VVLSQPATLATRYVKHEKSSCWLALVGALDSLPEVRRPIAPYVAQGSTPANRARTAPTSRQQTRYEREQYPRHPIAERDGQGLAQRS